MLLLADVPPRVRPQTAECNSSAANISTKVNPAQCSPSHHRALRVSSVLPIMPLVVATPVPTSLSAAQASHSLPPSQAEPNQPPILSHPAAKRKRKRPRVKGKKRVVLTAEQMPQQKKLRNGRVRSFDMNISEQHQQHEQQNLSRSQREFAALLSAANQPKATRNAKQHKQKRSNEIKIKPGETQQQFMSRVKEDTRKQVLAIARRDNKQRIKKRAYYERREQRMLRRKKKRSGQLSDSDAEQFSDPETNTAPGVSLSQLPLYWQDIVRNNGRPVSKKKRRREEQQDVVKFGEQVQRPPKLEKIAIRHGKGKPYQG